MDPECARQIGHHGAQEPESRVSKEEFTPSRPKHDELDAVIEAKKAEIIATMREQRVKEVAEKQARQKAAAAERAAQMTVKEKKNKEYHKGHQHRRSKAGKKRKRDNLKRNNREHQEAVAAAVAVATAELQESWKAKSPPSLSNKDGVKDGVGAVEDEGMSCDDDPTANSMTLVLGLEKYCSQTENDHE